MSESAFTLYDLPEATPEDYGPCIYDSIDGDPPRLVYYDDDDYWCSHGLDDNPGHECGDIRKVRTKKCFLDSGAIIHSSEGCDGHCETVPYVCLRRIDLEIAAKRYETSREGWVYAVSIVPEIDLRRLKIGYTTRPIDQRLKQYRTANPTAVLVGLWDADARAEDVAHRAIEGRLGRSEVFAVPDLYAALNRLHEALR
jgi:hypothetical protein